MRRILLSVVFLSVAAAVYAQSDRYEQRYDLLVSQFGPAGIGVETVLDNWEKADSTNAKMLLGRFSYLFTKAQRSEIVTMPTKKYLGMDPVLTLKDSLGADVYYYQINEFDDELYGEAVRAADKAVSVWPDRLDFRFLKANAYIAYEKESPDMALAYLKGLADGYASRKGQWTYDDEAVDDAFFQDSMQEYCYSFYSIGSPASYEAFLSLSQTMYGMFPDNTGYLNNIGTYYLIAKADYKTAYKYYNKVLKKVPDDYTAIKNCIIAARKQKNLKQEKKYLEMMMKYGPEIEKDQAQARLLNMK